MHPSRSAGRNPETCRVCREPKTLGTCDFGKGNPFVVSKPHCRTCCTLPVRDNWRALPAGDASQSRVRRILRKYAETYARMLGRITDARCGDVIQAPKQA